MYLILAQRVNKGCNLKLDPWINISAYLRLHFEVCKLLLALWASNQYLAVQPQIWYGCSGLAIICCLLRPQLIKLSAFGDSQRGPFMLPEVIRQVLLYKSISIYFTGWWTQFSCKVCWTRSSLKLSCLSICCMSYFDLYVYDKSIMIEQMLNHVEITIIKRQGQQKVTFPLRDILFSCACILDSWVIKYF